MKKIFLSVIILLVGIISKAQVPQAFSYQAVIRNSSNILVNNQTVSERISLLKDSTTGTVVYSETQSVKTNANGLVSLQIGKGSVLTGNFSTINWATGNYFIKIETDPNGGSNYSLSNTTQLLSVPYALNSGNGVKNGNSIGNMLYWNGSNWDTIKVGKKGQFLQLNSNNVPQWTGLTYPTITTLPASNITFKSSVLKGIIIDGGGIGIDSVFTSFYISTVSNAPLSSCKQINSFQRNADTFYIDLLGSGDSLLPNTTYYVRASGYNNQYNDASGGKTIANEISFTTINNTSLVVTTISYDTIQSPLLVGGKVTGSTSVTERGILYGLADTLNISNSTLVGKIQYQVSYGYGGFGTPSLTNGKITAGSGLGNYSTQILWLINNKKYYIKAYAIDSSGKIYYGNTITVSPRTYLRDPSRFDIANVFWNNQYTLFDDETDEKILPNNNGSYTFWYSSNENPVVQQTTMTPPFSFLFYKFKSQANCQRWCDIHNGIIKP